MKKLCAVLLVAAALLVATPASADEPTQLVERKQAAASEGCS